MAGTARMNFPLPDSLPKDGNGLLPSLLTWRRPLRCSRGS